MRNKYVKEKDLFLHIQIIFVLLKTFYKNTETYEELFNNILRIYC